MAEDKSWNGQWEFAYNVSLHKGRWNQSGRVWTAWFRIPYSDLDAGPAVEGQRWGFNVGRYRGRQYMIWKDGRSATDPAALGSLIL